MAKLQVALDGTLVQAMAVLEQVAPIVAIAEIGTLLVYREGIHAARHLGNHFPGLQLLADFKIIDAGDEEASIAFEAGCAYVTVMGVASDRTIEGVINAARRYGRQVVADMMQAADPVARGRELLALGSDILCVHTAFDDRESATPLESLRQLRQAFPDACLAVAGGITLENVASLMEWQPDIIVVGGAITRAADPARVARALRERM